MNRISLMMMLYAVLITGTSRADEVRVIAPATHSLLPAIDAGDDRKSARDTTGLKPARPVTTSPILVDHTATIGSDGAITYRCGNSSRRDFRDMKARSLRNEGGMR